ncbi:hypothetical protein LCGC14_0251400 [marine sediment metagenome]|uniref:Uncharacterized protein n=1 Tax=marine sediment metagenome TaxID=412755 RepID=A0A0F9X8X6_9ZZZZ
MATKKPAPDPVIGGERESEHTSWCRSNELDLCSGCSVKKGWDRNGVTGEPTTCRDGVPHEWPPRPCNCGPNDKRKGDRRFTHPPAPSDGLRENVVRCKAVSRETGRQCVRFAGSGAGICEVHRRGDATGLIDADHSREQLDDGLREALEEIKALEPILSLPHDQQSVVRLLNKVWKIARTALDKGKTDNSLLERYRGALDRISSHDVEEPAQLAHDTLHPKGKG